MRSAPLAVAVFNDSPTLRSAIRAAIATAPDLRIVAERETGEDAAEVVAQSGADVVVMDVVMPFVDGFQASRDIMQRRPTPILMVSSVVDPRDQDNVLAALQAGALHIAEPPPGPGARDRDRRVSSFIELLRTIAGARVTSTQPRQPTSRPSAGAPGQVDVIGLVSSAGGPQALLQLLPALPRNLPPILLVQHIAQGFAAGFARWLGQTTGYPVTVATDGERAVAGRLYLAPEDRHLWVDERLCLVVDDGPPRDGFRPSGDLLLEKLAQAFGARAAGIILSGMGDDGEHGARTLCARGGPVVVQADPLIDGMPEAAAPYGHRLPIQEIGPWLSERSGLS